MFQTIQKYMTKPALYASSTAKFWDDDYISQNMLEAHLNPVKDGATRKYEFVRKSVQWISKVAPSNQYPKLLDLGCGPGIYAEDFQEAGYQVTGLDLSIRSIQYAKQSSLEKNLPIQYRQGDYLTLHETEEYDIITLIYCDFGVLSTTNRAALLHKIYQALKPNGVLIFDVFTPLEYKGREEYKSWEYNLGGFFSPKPHFCLKSFYRYEKERTFMNQYLVVTEREVNCYNVWEHTFLKEEIAQDLKQAGFHIQGFYGDIAGKEYSEMDKEMCMIAEKTVGECYEL